jgi:hypothetical protein
MRYAQIQGGQKLHLVYEPGEGVDSKSLIPAGHLGTPLCGRHAGQGYRMTINMPLANACKNCQRVYRARHAH